MTNEVFATERLAQKLHEDIREAYLLQDMLDRLLEAHKMFVGENAHQYTLLQSTSKGVDNWLFAGKRADCYKMAIELIIQGSQDHDQ